MDRDELNAMLEAMENSGLSVKPDGSMVNAETGDEFAADKVAEALRTLEAEVARLSKIVAWAKAAPELAK